MIRCSLVALISIWALSVAAQQLDFNPNCESAYQNIVALKTDDAQKLIEQEKKVNPQNTLTNWLEAYSDFSQIFATESVTRIEQFTDQSDQRIRKLASADENSPFYLHSQGDVYLFNALSQFLIKNPLQGVFDLRRAYKLFDKNLELFPAFLPSQKSLALIKTLLGVVPSNYQWILKLLGMEGNMTNGLAQLKKLADLNEEQFDFKVETNVIYISLLIFLKSESILAWQRVIASQYPINDNLLTDYIFIQTALKSNHNEEALEIFSLMRDKASYEKLPLLNYYHGLSLLNKLEFNNAQDHFEQFLNSWEGEKWVKSTYQKIAWTYLLQGNIDSYRKNMNKTQEEGSENNDQDKQAMNEANSAAPNPALLKARLLFDGGYYEKALQTTEAVKLESLNENEILEFNYRNARIRHEMKNLDAAIKSYKQTLEQGRKSSKHYAANAALNLGYIYRSKNDIDLAVYYFQECISLKNHDYETSIEQKAEIALQQLKH